MTTLTRITVVMPIKNELQHIGVIDDILTSSKEFVREIIVMDDKSDDGTLQALEKKARIYPHLQVHRNLQKLNLNEMICYMLNLVQTDLVHVRSPHDFYSKYFYEYHSQKFAAFPSSEASFNDVGLISKMSPNNLPVAREVRLSKGNLTRIFDKNLSSCGFICKTKALTELWKKYESFDKFTDWLVKKELMHFREYVYTKNILSLYNDTLLRKCEPQAGSIAAHKIEEKVFDAVYFNFWVNRACKRYFCLPRELISTKRAIKFFNKRPFDIWLALHLCRWVLLKSLKTAFAHLIKK